MKFLIDQDVYAATVRLLTGLGHDVATASQRGLARAEDTELLRERVLTLYNEQELQASFVVVAAGRHRIRRVAARHAP